jgi:hypothetical protein
MKKFLPYILLILGAGTTQASILETISFNLSALHPGSTLSGTFSLSDSPAPGDSALVQLSFSDPADYSASPLSATIKIGNGTTLAYTVSFNTITFTNPSGNAFTTNVNLLPQGAAQCASFPCTATGGFADNSPAAFSSTYTIAPAVSAVPEPACLGFCGFSLAAFALRKTWVKRSTIK